MVKNEEQVKRCGSCKEINGCVWQGFVYCSYLNQDVWAQSIRCQHGNDIDEIF
ncbi:MAG: hypothetical protein IKU98_07145 [Bacteroidaceae bacterium]|nr:hypothetical protein [Bacteroidaceae bacterium]